jgi:hypothetical protein
LTAVNKKLPQKERPHCAITYIFDFELEAGDAFDTFRFEQAAKRELA